MTSANKRLKPEEPTNSASSHLTQAVPDFELLVPELDELVNRNAPQLLKNMRFRNELQRILKHFNLNALEMAEHAQVFEHFVNKEKQETLHSALAFGAIAIGIKSSLECQKKWINKRMEKHFYCTEYYYRNKVAIETAIDNVTEADINAKYKEILLFSSEKANENLTPKVNSPAPKSKEGPAKKMQAKIPGNFEAAPQVSLSTPSADLQFPKQPQTQSKYMDSPELPSQHLENYLSEGSAKEIEEQLDFLSDNL